MREYPNVYVVMSSFDEIEGIFYNRKDAWDWIGRQTDCEFPYQEFWIDGPYKVL